ncbi:hypothetical protein CLAIMM_01224 [Cladophialophora immunda]|nr:hypothetical protein CLAIMM_01224 [Cladophialophora immunda]
MGPIQLADSRESVIKRMCALLDAAAQDQTQIVVFPELAFTTFFPRHFIPDEEELAGYFEFEDPAAGGIEQSPNVKPLFDHAKNLGIDIYVGYAERSPTAGGGHVDYNSSAYYSAREQRVLAKYRKVHLPGVTEPFLEPGATQQLENRYFRRGNLGFRAFRGPGLVGNTLKVGDLVAKQDTAAGKGDPILGMIICNDRRWPEAWRCYGLQGVELMFCGYNTTAFAPQLLGSDPNQSRESAESDVLFHHALSCQANSYLNSCFSVNVAKCGREDGHDLISGTMIVGPNGKIIAEAKTKGDELVATTIDLAECRRGKEKTFDFDRHRCIDHYDRLAEQTGVVEPELLPAKKVLG